MLLLPMGSPFDKDTNDIYNVNQLLIISLSL